MKIILIGFMGSGKTSVAKCLSPLLGLSRIEMDDLVYQKTNTSTMQEVFALGGELLLRETEIAIGKEIALQKRVVIATGGGVVLNKIIFDYFKQEKSLVIFLRATFTTIAMRLEGHTQRPLFQHLPTAKKMYHFRAPLYLHYADKVIDVDDLTPEEIAQKIKKIFL
jgi:shikimate kinase